MFQFTTTTVINSAFEATYTPTGIENNDKKHSLVTNNVTVTDENGTESDGPGNCVTVKRVASFKKDYITHMYKQEAVDPIPAMAKISLDDLSDLLEEFDSTKTLNKNSQLRLNMYIGLSQGSNDSMYATDSWFKGKPLCIDFMWAGNAAKTAKALAKLIKKFMLTVHGEKFMDITDNGDCIEIQAVNEYQRFRMLNIEYLDSDKNRGLGEWYVLKKLAFGKSDEDTEDKSYITPVKAEDGEITLTDNTYFCGQEGFGTYAYILHNLRLPTNARMGWEAINSEEVPIVGAKYNQYTIHYCVNRGTLGTNAVGDQVTSHTTHVFYVKQDLAEAFEEAFTEIGVELEAPYTEKKSDNITDNDNDNDNDNDSDENE